MMPMWKAGIWNKSGFTFIEIAVALFIISIFAAVASPRLLAFFSSETIERSASRLGLYIEHVRDEAVYKRRFLSLTCAIEEGRFMVTSSGEDEQGLLMRPFTLPESIKIVDIDIQGRGTDIAGESFISFSPGGMADGAFIHLRSDDEKELTIKIFPLAREIDIYEGYVEGA
ncbi:MAG: type II secretion system protein [bacterium]|nr:type II secretion system protein [bacterium]